MAASESKPTMAAVHVTLCHWRDTYWKTRDPYPLNPYPRVRVQVSWGTGTGSLGKPQGYPWQSLLLGHESNHGYTTPNQNVLHSALFCIWRLHMGDWGRISLAVQRTFVGIPPSRSESILGSVLRVSPPVNVLAGATLLVMTSIN